MVRKKQEEYTWVGAILGIVILLFMWRLPVYMMEDSTAEGWWYVIQFIFWFNVALFTGMMLTNYRSKIEQHVEWIKGKGQNVLVSLKNSK